jgi:hypothetical protein
VRTALTNVIVIAGLDPQVSGLNIAQPFDTANCLASAPSTSWPAFVPAIHAFHAAKQDVDGRDKRGHDDC